MKAICFALVLRFSEEFNGDIALKEELRKKAWITKDRGSERIPRMLSLI